MKVYIGPHPDGSGERDINVEIDDYDTWGADNTLALIAVPLLERFKEKTKSIAFTEDEDITNELKDGEEYSKEKWEYILDEIIYGLKGCLEEAEDVFYSDTKMEGWVEIKRTQWGVFYIDEEGLEKHQERVDNGLRLFGKYFRALWS